MNDPALREKLKKEIDQCVWKDLIPHAARGSVIVVDSFLDLLDVAVAVAQDEADQVKLWMEHGQLGRVSDDQLKAWNEMPDKVFQMVVVAPYILIQEILSS